MQAYLSPVGVLRMNINVNFLALWKTVFMDAIVTIAHVFVGFGIDGNPGAGAALFLVVIVAVPVGESLGADGALVRRASWLRKLKKIWNF